MRITVLGAGAIGSIFGAKLAADNDVTLVGRPEHVTAIRNNGAIQVEGLETRIVALQATEHVEAIDAATVILVTTKVPATARAVEPIAPLVRADTTVICLQNGLGAETIAREVIGDRCVVLRGITQLGAIFDRPGAIKFMADGETVIEHHERSEAIARVFNQAGLSTSVSDDIRCDVWRKLILNCVVNPITTMLGSEVGAIANPELNELKQIVIDECLAVAVAEGIHLDTDFQREISRLYAPSHNIVSMRQDLSRGRQTEIDYLNGAVAALGAKYGIDCPVNSALTQIIKSMEARHCSHKKCSSRS